MIFERWHGSFPILMARNAIGLCVGLICLLMVPAKTEGQSVRLKDHTDWWSISNESFHRDSMKPRTENIDEGTFEIDGISLGRDEFKSAVSKLGRATVVERGDASTGRKQICYIVTNAGNESYLIFEFGEDESTFYILTDGSGWSGRNLCVSSALISSTVGTASGLRLGLSPTRVEAILGKADSEKPDRLVYFRETSQKTTPEEFARLRQDYPEKLSDSVAHQKFDFYSIEVYIEARFGPSGLTYLVVSKSDDSD